MDFNKACPGGCIAAQLMPNPPMMQMVAVNDEEGICEYSGDYIEDCDCGNCKDVNEDDPAKDR